MASNMSTLGFDYEEQAGFADAMTMLANETVEHLSSTKGEYAIWRSRTGAEIWFHLSAPGEGGERDIIGLTPFFEGRSDNLMSITHVIRRPDDNLLEGAFYAWMAPDAETGEGSYPVVFDAVDFAAQSDREPPLHVGVRLTGFARELRCFPTEAAFTSAPAGNGQQLAPKAFIPIGLFAAASATEERDADEPPSSTAIITGRVLEHRLLTNEATAQCFHWLLVESLDASFDIVADPDVVTGEIVNGGTVECACWLVGRVLG